jgi:excisionase family DNA binding protein
MQNVLTVDEAAAELGIAPRNLRTWILRGRLKARKVGPVWLIDRGDLATFSAWWKAHPRAMVGKRSQERPPPA